MDSLSTKRPRDNSDEPDFKRQRVAAILELISKLTKDICEIGESTSNLVEGIEYMSRPIAVEIEKEDELRVAFLNIIYALIIEQPHKIQLISALVQLANAKNFLVGKYVLEFLHQKSQELLDSFVSGGVSDPLANDCGVFNKLKLLLRFFSCLAPIINDYQVINLYKQFANISIELNQGEHRNGLAEQLFYNVLVNIPYLIVSDHTDEMKRYCAELVELSTQFKIKHDKTERLYKPFLANESVPIKNLFEITRDCLIRMKADDWELDFLLDINSSIQENLNISLENNAISSELVKHSLPQLSISAEKINSSVNDGVIDTMWENQRNVYQIFTSAVNLSNVTTQPEIDSYQFIILKDIIIDIIINLEFNRKEIANQLLLLDLYFKPKFWPSDTTLDQIAMVEQKQTGPVTTWKLEDIVIDNIFSLIFSSVPSMKIPPIHYYTILIECCMNQSTIIAPVLGRGIRYFYNNFLNLNFELRFRYIDWFSIQLSNFSFTWKWGEWEKDSMDLQGQTSHPKLILYKNLIMKEIQLSNHKNIQSTLIPEFLQYLDCELVDTAKYDLDLFDFVKEEQLGESNILNEIKYDYLVESFPFFPLIIKIVEYLSLEKSAQANNLNKKRDNLGRDGQKTIESEQQDEKTPESETKSTDADFFDSLSTSVTDLSTNPEKNEQILINLIFQTLCFAGSRSISHIDNFIQKNKDQLKKIKISSENKDQWIMDSVIRFWAKSSQVSTIVLEKLAQYEIISKESLLKKLIDENRIIHDINVYDLFSKFLKNGQDIEQIVKLIVDKLNSYNITDKSTTDWNFLSVYDLLKIVIRKNPTAIEAVKELHNEFYRTYILDCF